MHDPDVGVTTNVTVFRVFVVFTNVPESKDEAAFPATIPVNPVAVGADQV